MDNGGKKKKTQKKTIKKKVGSVAPPSWGRKEAPPLGCCPQSPHVCLEDPQREQCGVSCARRASEMISHPKGMSNTVAGRPQTIAAEKREKKNSPRAWDVCWEPETHQPARPWKKLC